MAEDRNLERQSFRNPAVAGGGTMLPDGSVAHTLDPVEARGGVGGRTTSGGRALPERVAAPEPVKVDAADAVTPDAADTTKSKRSTTK